GQLAAGDQLRDAREILVHHAILLHRRAYRPDRRVRYLQWLGSLERCEKVNRLRRRHGLDGQRVARVLHHLLQLVRGGHAHGNEVFFVSGGRNRIDRSGMRQHFVFTHQRGGGDLRHHEAGVHSRTRREKWRQAFAERGVYHALQPSLADAGQRAQSNGEKVEREGERLAVKIAARKNVALTIHRLRILHEHER